MGGGVRRRPALQERACTRTHRPELPGIPPNSFWGILSTPTIRAGPCHAHVSLACHALARPVCRALARPACGGGSIIVCRAHSQAAQLEMECLVGLDYRLGPFFS